MTKLLILSDSHGARDAIKRILNKEQNNVDAVIFLGDGLRDLEQALAFFPHLRVYSVAGNCDLVHWSRWTAWQASIRQWFFIHMAICTV